MPQKILVANRGEIAVRIIRACDELKIKSVSVFSDEDERSLFHRLAGERVNIRGVDAKDTYLNLCYSHRRRLEMFQPVEWDMKLIGVGAKCRQSRTA